MDLQTNNLQQGFKVNMRIIADVLEREMKKIEFYSSGCDCRLDGVKLYNPGKELNSNYVYCVNHCDVNKTFISCNNIAFIVIGRTDHTCFSSDSPVIQVIDDSSILDIFDLVQDTFEKYRNWDWRLQQALHSSRPLDEMVLASVEVFHNPMFIHDSNFFILSDPAHMHGMLDWDIDPRTGRPIVPVSQINDFMVDRVYLEGMKAKKAVMFPQEQRGYQILYFNLWNEGRYEGRILVDEIIRPIQPGDFHTDLYNTLRVYLRLNRNVLQTSKELFIHRSTLMYRLSRIDKITGVDLNDAKECLKLSISYYMLERDV